MSKETVLSLRKKLRERNRELAAMRIERDAALADLEKHKRNGEERKLSEKIRIKNERLEISRQRLTDRNQDIADLKVQLQRFQTLTKSRSEIPTFFLVGCAKSGTSWLMRLLDSHPEITCKGEGRILGRRYKRPDVAQMDTNTLQPSSLYRAVLDSEYLRLWAERSVWGRGEDAEVHMRGMTRVLTSYFLHRRVVADGKNIVGDKTPFLSEEIVAEINDIYPDAKIIHIIRDGRDVAVSAMHHMWNHPVDLGGGFDLESEEEEKREEYRSDTARFMESGEGIFTEARIEHMAESWKSQVGRAIKDGPDLFGDNYIEVRYENLLNNPQSEMGRILAFLEADATEEKTSNCVESASFERWTKGRERGREDSTVLLRKGVVGDWKEVFTESDRSIFKKIAGEFLIELGYELDTDW